MRFLEIIEKKRNGEALSQAEIQFWIDGYVQGTIPDYQVAALLMAIYFQDLNLDETVELTRAMTDSGELVDLGGISGMKADKHSTGGVGDKTTLVLAPLVAAGGVRMAKMSGRGLGHTGGTLDKLESIPGFCSALTAEQFRRQVESIGLAVIGQTGEMVPADKKLYALRDVTATVESIPLIASSVMSKKLAAGADVIVLDVKYGSGAFMKTPARAEALAKVMVGIGQGVGRRVTAIISSMEQPLGFAIGNALEVKEAIHTLQGKGPADLTELCLHLAGEIFFLTGKAVDVAAGINQAETLLANGTALQKLAELITAQGGNAQVIENEKLLPEAAYRISVIAPHDGYIQSMDAQAIGLAAMKLGAGRSTKEDVIDPAVGIICRRKTGDQVSKGDTLAMIHANDEERVGEVKEMILASYLIGEAAVDIPALIYGRIDRAD